MGVALGWVVFALAGVAAAPATDQIKEIATSVDEAPAGRIMVGAGPKNSEITYTIQYIETEGLGWRAAMFTQLRPVARQGAATIWTAPQAVAKRFLSRVTATPGGKVFQTPKVTAPNGGPVHITSRSNCHLVTQVAWTGEDQAAEPEVEKVRTGWLATMVGRRLDQGVLVQLVLEDTEIASVHNVKVAESCNPACAKTASAWVPKPAAGALAVKGKVAKRTDPDETPDCSEEKCARAQGCCEMADDEPLEDDADVQQLTIAVPEIRTQEVAGEWLIPKDGVLLVSFGVYTIADQNGKAVVKERLAMISAIETDSGSAAERPRRTIQVPIAVKPGAVTAHVPKIPPPAPLAAPPPVVVPAAPFIPFAPDRGLNPLERAPLTVPALPAGPVMPQPAVPSRTMPEGIHEDGTISNLPPLPEEAEQSTSESSEPMASPQTKKHQQAKPPTDAGATKASFVPRTPAPFSIPSLFMPNVSGAPAGLQFLLPIKPFSIRLPFKQRLEIEVFGRLVPDTEPSPKPVERAEN